MSDALEWKPKKPRLRRKGECDPGKHRWVDVFDAIGKKVECVACGKFYGRYEIADAKSCLKLIP